MTAVHPYYHKFSCMTYDFRFLVRNSGQTASLMSHTGSDHLFCIKRYYNVTAYDIMAWSPPAAMWETRGTLILGWNDWPQGFQGLTRRTLQRWGLLQQNNLIEQKVSVSLPKGVHWHRRDGEWYFGRNLWAVQVCVINQLWHLLKLQNSFTSGANWGLTRGCLKWWLTRATRTFPFQLQTKCLPGGKSHSNPNFNPTDIHGLQAGRCSSIFFKAFLFSCTPFCNSEVPL